MIRLNIPIKEEDILNLKAGDRVLLSGIMVTGRDAAHKYIVEKFINGTPEGEDKEIYEKLSSILKEGVLYHCGPVVKKENGGWRIVAAGPTTSIREEPYEADVIKFFGIRGIIGKGGMGDKTLQALVENKAVYFHAIGGAAALIANSLLKVVDVFKLDFGLPEAFWVVEAKDFPVIVTMDAHGNSLHKKIEEESKKIFDKIV